MKTINEIFWINRALPCFEVSKFTQPMSEFDTRCENLSRYMPFVMMHFQWAGAHDDEERTCSLHNLGYKLHRALVEVKAIYEKRSQQLCDEHCEQFEELMTLVQTYSWHIIHFIEEAEELFADACENNRLDKVQRQTGLDLRKFDDAVTFKMMMLLGKSGKDKPRPVY